MKKVSPLVLFVILLSSLAFAGSSDVVQKWLDFKASARSGGTSKGVAVDMGDGTFVVLNGSVQGACADGCPSADGATAPQSMEALSAGIKLWATGTYSACSNTCGDGTYTRTVSCVTPSGQAATGCEEGTKPSVSGICHDMNGCSRNWSLGTFSACAPACGASVQTRSVTCLRSDGATIDDDQCSGEKPALAQSCSDSSRCSYLWSAGEFGECAAGCSETSSRSRTITCLRHDQTGANADAPVPDASCSGSGAKPDASESCPSFAACVAPSATVSVATDVLAGVSTTFTPSLSGNVGSCSWVFGDGMTASGCGAQPHVYAAKGVYSPSLSLVGTNTLQTSNVAIHAVSAWDPANGSSIAHVENKNVPFTSPAVTSNFSFTKVGDAASCSWSFGDGTVAQNGCSNQAHAFTSTGTKTVTVTITGSGGDVTNKTLSVVVENAKSCLAIKNADPSLPDGSYTIYPNGNEIGVWCDMTSAGGGWTIVAAQFEAHPSVWSGAMTNYDHDLSNGYGWSLPSTLLPPDRTQVAFGKDKSATATGYADYVYTTGNIAKTLVTDIPTGLQHHIARRSDGYYGNADPEGIFYSGATSVWRDCLTYDRVGGVNNRWVFYPYQTDVALRGYTLYDSTSKVGTGGAHETFAWTVWVR